MSSTDIKPCAVNIPVSAHITFHYKSIADRSSSRSSSSSSCSSATSKACSPRGSSVAYRLLYQLTMKSSRLYLMFPLPL